MASARYETAPRGIILSFLRSNQNSHFTVDEMTERLKAEGRPVGRTTVYRNLERLVGEGSVKRFDAPGSPACYRFVSDDGCREHHHLHCTSCGALLHVDCNYMDELAGHIESEHGFSVDVSRTVLYGLCAGCKGGRKGHA